jgi:capsid portal protein
MPEEFMEAAGEALLNKSVGKNDMDALLKVTFVGRDNIEAQGKKKAEDEGNGQVKSGQLDDFERLASGEFVPPTFNPIIWAQAWRQSTRLSRCIRTYARNTVGLGWHIEPIHPVTPETPDEEKKTIQEQTEILREFFSYPNERLPMTELMYLEKVDEEAMGTGYIEIVRNNSRNVARMYHAPATTIRRRIMTEGNEKVVYGYIQIRGARKRYFKEFGDNRVMDAKTGKWYKSKEPLPSSERATEILQFAIYDPISSFYGAPRYVSAATAIAGNRQAAIRNVAFFENDAVPRMALLISGGRITPDSMQQIEDFVRGKGRGTDQAHRVMIVQVEPAKIGFQQQNRTMVELKPLTVGVTEDQSFGAYRKDNDEEIREAFGLAQIFFQAEGANRANAQVAREITNEQELEPDRLMKEYIINQTIVTDLLVSRMKPDWRDDEEDNFEQIEEMRKLIRVRFRFARLTLTDPLDSARMDQIYASLGAMTPNELRESLGKPPYPKDYFFADKPISIALAELTAGLALAIAQKDEEKYPTPPAPPGGPGGMPLPDGIEPAPEISVPEEPEAEAEGGGKGEENSPKGKLGIDAQSPRRVSSQKRSDGKEKALSIVQELLLDARRLAYNGMMFAGGGGGRNGEHDTSR